MKIKIDRFYHQLFIIPYIGVTYGRPHCGSMFSISFGWLCFGVVIGFKKAKHGFYDRRL